MKTVQLRVPICAEEIRGKRKDFSCFLNVNACPLSLDSRRSWSGIEFQDAGTVTAKARRCVVAERQKGIFRCELVEERSTRPEPTDDQVQSSRRYDGPAPTINTVPDETAYFEGEAIWHRQPLN